MLSLTTVEFVERRKCNKSIVRTSTPHTTVNWAFSLVMFSAMHCPERPGMSSKQQKVVTTKLLQHYHNKIQY